MWRNRDELRARHRRSQCGNKIRFGTKEKAEKKIAELEDDKMNAYLCPFCFNWHIGHVPSSSKNIEKKASQYMKETVRKLYDSKRRLRENCWGCVFIKRQEDGTLMCFSTHPPGIRGSWKTPKKTPRRKNEWCWKSIKTVLRGKW